MDEETGSDNVSDIILLTAFECKTFSPQSTKDVAQPKPIHTGLFK